MRQACQKSQVPVAVASNSVAAAAAPGPTEASLLPDPIGWYQRHGMSLARRASWPKAGYAGFLPRCAPTVAATVCIGTSSSATAATGKTARQSFPSIPHLSALLQPACLNHHLGIQAIEGGISSVCKSPDRVSKLSRLGNELCGGVPQGG